MEITLPPAMVEVLREEYSGAIGEYIEKCIGMARPVVERPGLAQFIREGAWLQCLACKITYSVGSIMHCPDCGDKKVRLLDALEKTARDTEQSSKAKKAVSARKPSCKGAAGRARLGAVLERARRSSRA
jgi:hypothetical protein